MVSWEDDRPCKRVCSLGGVSRVSHNLKPSELDILLLEGFRVPGSDLVLECRTGAEPGSTLNPPVLQPWLIGSGSGLSSESIYIFWIGMVSKI